MLGEGLSQGGIGIGAGIVYTPGAGHKEIFELVKAVGRYGVALFVHIRGGTKQLGFEDFQCVLLLLDALLLYLCLSPFLGRPLCACGSLMYGF